MSKERGEDSSQKSVVLITGMSGAGKHSAVKAFEDMGYFCVDNIPTALIPRLIQMTIASGGQIERLAVVVDVRLGESLADDFKKLFRRLKQLPFNSKVVFFDASEMVLAQRYSETRRVHPLARGSSLLEGFRREKTELAEVRSLADVVVDTTAFSVHDLRDFIYTRFRDHDPGADSSLNVSIVSFGFKRGLPYNADLVFDVRFLPNPHFVSYLKPLTGEDHEVKEFLNLQPETGEMLGRLEDMLEYLLPRYEREGKSYCTVAIGCTGGKHRSVMLAAELAARLGEKGFSVNLVHRDIHLE